MAGLMVVEIMIVVPLEVFRECLLSHRTKWVIRHAVHRFFQAPAAHHGTYLPETPPIMPPDVPL